MSSVMELVHSVIGLATSGDWVGLAIIVVIAVAAGMLVQHASAILSATVGALVIFALATFVRGVMSVKNANASAIAQSDWNHLLKLPVHDLIVYAIAFAVLIAIVHVIRQVVASR